MRLILVRHGETKNQKYNGITDVPLSRQGYSQAELIKRRLERESVKKIYASNLSRAVETAKIINLPHRVNLKIERDLREINFGLWEGFSFSEISIRYKKQLEKWAKEKTNFRFPEGETLGEMRERIVRVLDRIKTQFGDETIVMVGHGGPIRIILCEILSLDLSNFWKISLDLGSISVIELNKKNQVVALMNDTCHLESK